MSRFFDFSRNGKQVGKYFPSSHNLHPESVFRAQLGGPQKRAFRSFLRIPTFRKRSILNICGDVQLWFATRSTSNTKSRKMGLFFAENIRTQFACQTTPLTLHHCDMSGRTMRDVLKSITSTGREGRMSGDKRKGIYFDDTWRLRDLGIS